MGRKLYVGNFPYETGEAELQGLFARAGTVETVKVMRDMATGRARGFAFVEMSTEDEASQSVGDRNAARGQVNQPLVELKSTVMGQHRKSERYR